MPREIKEMKDFLLRARSEGTRSVTIKKSKRGGATKFKLRTKKYLYTLAVPDKDKAKKVEQSLPPGVNVTRLG